MKERTRQWLMKNYWQKWLPTMPLQYETERWSRWLKGVRDLMERGLAERIDPKAIVPGAEAWVIARRLTRKFLEERLGKGVTEALDNKEPV
jgi:hypothetical protein